jgi:hypothetical protein
LTLLGRGKCLQRLEPLTLRNLLAGLGTTAAISNPPYGHFTAGGIEERIDSTLPPVFSPNNVPRS